MNRIAKFLKVSYDQWIKDSPLSEVEAKRAYDHIKLPVRSTEGSAGYDFFAPYDFEIPSGESLVISTGIRGRMEPDWVLCLFPRSGMGFRQGIRLANTVGVIDADYFFADNEGHILIKLLNPSEKKLKVKHNSAFAQGIFFPFGVTYDDEAQGGRHGGFGSTDQKTETHSPGKTVASSRPSEMRLIEPVN